MKRFLVLGPLLISLAATFCAVGALAMTPEERRAYRDELLKILPKQDLPGNQPNAGTQFADWIKKYDEVPPDFDALPKVNGLPDPMKFFDGRAVKTAEDWKARRAEILDLYQKYVFGTLPPHPKLDHADVTETPGGAGQGFTTRMVVLHVGPEGKGTMHVTLQIPEGKGPFPVFMSPGGGGGPGGRGGPGGARGRGGPGGVAPGEAPATIPATVPAAAGGAAPGGRAAGPGGRGPAPGVTARMRGYIAVGFNASDGNDDSINIGALYPQGVNDPGDLPRRGWSASCVVDYLATMPEVDMKKIAIFGYSRDGKMITIAAALDERISAVYAGSAGVGGILAYRNAGERDMAEGIQSTTMMFPTWFNPRLRYFAGREDRLPVDGNLLLATIAPRPFILIAGRRDEVSNDWGDEQSMKSAQKVYDFLDAPDKLAIHRVDSAQPYHGANDVEVGLNFLDTAFGKSDKKFVSDYMFPWDFDAWMKANNGDFKLDAFPELKGRDILSGPGPISTTAAWESKADGVRKSLLWLLGDAKAAANAPAAPAPAATPDVPAWIIGRSVTAQGGQGLLEFGWYAKIPTEKRDITFGNNLKGTIYYPANAKAGDKLPTVIWLHSYSYPLGYMWVYRRDVHPIQALVNAGYAVLAYDQAGFGSRMAETAGFYDRTPNWSEMGEMVADARAAIDALSKDAAVDAARISLFGYSLGGTVAIYTGALDARVHSVVSICGFTPMRTETAEKGTGSLARLSVEHGLIPRLGNFIGHESQVPVDYDELIGAMAPRPVCVVSPKYDRDATPADVHAAVEAARKVYTLYNAGDKLKLDEPWDYNRLSDETQDRIIAWLKTQ